MLPRYQSRELNENQACARELALTALKESRSKIEAALHVMSTLVDELATIDLDREANDVECAIQSIETMLDNPSAVVTLANLESAIERHFQDLTEPGVPEHDRS